MSLMSAANIAQNGLGVVEQQIAVASNNITNANNPGYTRETYTTDTFTLGNAVIALGGSVRTSVDANLNKEITNQNSSTQMQSVLNTYLQSYDNSLGSIDSTSGSTLSSGLSTLTSALTSLSGNPSLSSSKSAVISAAQNLTSQLNNLSSTLQNARLQANQQMGASVTTINSTLADLASINKEITQATVNTNTADMQDQRDTDLQTLSGLMGIQYNMNSDGQVQVYTTSGQLLLSGSNAASLNYTPSQDVSNATTYPGGFPGVTLQGVDITTGITTGALGALIQLRDTTLPNEQSKLDALANSMQTTVNAALNQGASVPPRTTLTGSAVVNGTDAFVGTGTVRIAVTDNTGTVQNYADIDLSSYNTVNKVINAINGMGGVIASVNSSGNLVITSANPSDGISINQGSSTIDGTSQGFSSYFGLNNMFDGTNGASDIHVSNYLQANPGYLASGTLSASGTLTGGEIGITAGDNSTANNMLSALTTPATLPAAGDFAAQTTTFSGYIAAIIGGVATSASSAQTASTNSQSVLTALQNTASNEDGVNIDQETANAATLENAYSATAKILSTIDSMFTTLLQNI